MGFGSSCQPGLQPPKVCLVWRTHFQMHVRGCWQPGRRPQFLARWASLDSHCSLLPRVRDQRKKPKTGLGLSPSNLGYDIPTTTSTIRCWSHRPCLIHCGREPHNAGRWGYQEAGVTGDHLEAGYNILLKKKIFI